MTLAMTLFGSLVKSLFFLVVNSEDLGKGIALLHFRVGSTYPDVPETWNERRNQKAR